MFLKLAVLNERFKLAGVTQAMLDASNTLKEDLIKNYGAVWSGAEKCVYTSIYSPDHL